MSTTGSSSLSGWYLKVRAGWTPGLWLDQEVVLSLDHMEFPAKTDIRGVNSELPLLLQGCDHTHTHTLSRRQEGVDQGKGGSEGGGGVKKNTHCPPKSCIPSRAKTTMNRKRRKSKLMMDFMELRRETTRFLREFQYLRGNSKHSEELGFFFYYYYFWLYYWAILSHASYCRIDR